MDIGDCPVRSKWCAQCGAAVDANHEHGEAEPDKEFRKRVQEIIRTALHREGIAVLSEEPDYLRVVCCPAEQPVVIEIATSPRIEIPR